MERNGKDFSYFSFAENKSNKTCLPAGRETLSPTRAPANYQFSH